jgi:hypothetical protein
VVNERKSAIEHPNAKGQTLNMRVEGMDCGACALKIENALKRLPGVSDINVNYGKCVDLPDTGSVIWRSTLTFLA